MYSIRECEILAFCKLGPHSYIHPMADMDRKALPLFQ